MIVQNKVNVQWDQDIKLIIAWSWISMLKEGFQFKTNNGNCNINQYPRVDVKHT